MTRDLPSALNARLSGRCCLICHSNVQACSSVGNWLSKVSSDCVAQIVGVSGLTVTEGIHACSRAGHCIAMGRFGAGLDANLSPPSPPNEQLVTLRTRFTSSSGVGRGASQTQTRTIRGRWICSSLLASRVSNRHTHCASHGNLDRRCPPGRPRRSACREPARLPPAPGAR